MLGYEMSGSHSTELADNPKNFSAVQGEEARLENGRLLGRLSRPFNDAEVAFDSLLWRADRV